MTGQWFSQGTPFSSTNKTDNDDITEILLKVALNTINLKRSRYNIIYYKANHSTSENNSNYVIRRKMNYDRYEIYLLHNIAFEPMM